MTVRSNALWQLDLFSCRMAAVNLVIEVLIEGATAHLVIEVLVDGADWLQDGSSPCY